MRLSRQAKVILCTLQSFNELIDAGIISGARISINPLYSDAVKNFKPTQEETSKCYAAMFIPQRVGGIKFQAGLASKYIEEPH